MFEKTLSDVRQHSERILIADFNGNPRTTVITHYAPVEGSPESEEHFKSLAVAIKSIPKHNLLMVIGDCNAHIGPQDAQYTFHSETNINGQHLIDLTQETNLVITNTCFQKKPGKLWTYISDMNRHTKTQIDYILVNRKWRNSVKDVEAYNSFASSGSDHRILSARVKLSLRTCRTPPKRPPYDWAALKDQDLQTKHTVQIKNRFNQLCEENETATEKYEHLIKANEETAKQLLPNKTKRKRTQYAKDKRVIAARQTVDEVYEQYEQDPSNVHYSKLTSAKANLEKAYNTAAEEDLTNLITKVEGTHSSHQHSESWKLIDEISNRKTAKKGIIKGTGKQDRLNKWHRHFSDLLGKEPSGNEDGEETQTVLPNMDINTEPFIMEEYRKVKGKLQTGKAPGHDGIPPEVYKYCNIDDLIPEFANRVLTGEDGLKQWSMMDILKRTT